MPDISPNPSDHHAAKIGVGIIGLSAQGGWAATGHLPALRQLNDAYEVIGLVPGDPDDLSYTLAHAYFYLVEDLRYGTQHVPTFADAVQRHRLLDRILQQA